MAKRKKNNVSVWDLLLLLIFLGIKTHYALKWTFIIIGVVIITIINLITSIIKLVKKKKIENNIITTPFENTKLNISESLLPPIQLQKKKLGIFDKNIYDDFFPIQIRTRGELYYYDNKIKKYKESNNKYSCLISGNKDYKVSITLDKEDMLIDSNCTCPFYSDKKINCKHIYALLYKVKCSENKDKILEEIECQINGIKTMLKNTNDYLKTTKSHLSNTIISDFNTYSKQYTNNIATIEKSVYEIKLEDSLLNKLETILNIKSQLNQKIKKTLKGKNTSNKKTTYVQPNNNSKENKISLSDVIAGINMVTMIDKNQNTQKDRIYDEKLEKEMDYYALEEWQKELVRKGQYDPWNFAEDGDLTEYDYYYEDD